MTPLIEQAQIVGIEIPPLQQIQQTINQLKTELKTVRADSPSLRKHMMKAQAIKHDSTGNTKGARAVRAILRTEERLEAYKTYKVISGNALQQQSFTSVQIPTSWKDFSEGDDPQSLEDPKKACSWTEVTLPEDIKRFAQLRNRIQFRQAETDRTPFTQHPLKIHLNWSADTNEAELML